mmetsp:Transcript_98898/g.308422  ORF Transcript_98898/g.308422 Transcript_98898/m.308422 type:complete len:310 (-) Transcript_98898:1339-2268(-)
MSLHGVLAGAPRLCSRAAPRPIPTRRLQLRAEIHHPLTKSSSSSPLAASPTPATRPLGAPTSTRSSRNPQTLGGRRAWRRPRRCATRPLVHAALGHATPATCLRPCRTCRPRHLQRTWGPLLNHSTAGTTIRTCRLSSICLRRAQPVAMNSSARTVLRCRPQIWSARRDLPGTMRRHLPPGCSPHMPSARWSRMEASHSRVFLEPSCRPSTSSSWSTRWGQTEASRNRVLLEPSCSPSTSSPRQTRRYLLRGHWRCRLCSRRASTSPAGRRSRRRGFPRRPYLHRPSPRRSSGAPAGQATPWVLYPAAR